MIFKSNAHGPFGPTSSYILYKKIVQNGKKSKALDSEDLSSNLASLL